MSLYYNAQFIGRHMVTVLRVFFVTNVGAQLYDIYFNCPTTTITNTTTHVTHNQQAAAAPTIMQDHHHVTNYLHHLIDHNNYHNNHNDQNHHHHHILNNNNNNPLHDHLIDDKHETITAFTNNLTTTTTTTKSTHVIIKDLIENGSTWEQASLRYILLKNSESIIPLIALASVIAVISKFIHKLFLLFMIVDDQESASSAGLLSGWLFIIICLQCGITSLDDEDRYWRLLRNFGLIVIVNLHTLFKPVSDRLQSLSASRSKTIHKHLRVLIVGLSTIILPSCFLFHLWSQKSINSWTLTVTVFGFEMIFRMSISLIIYTMCMINSFCDVTWHGLEDQIYYLKASCGMISYLCGISLFFNGTWVLVFENSTVLRALSLCIHLYFNIWNQAWKGWNVFNKRRLASTKMNHLRDATEKELIALDDVCSICFQQLDQAKVTGCNHYFHADCLTRWLYLQDTCPNCCSLTLLPPSASKKFVSQQY